MRSFWISRQVVAQAVSLRLLITEDRVQTDDSPCDGRNSTGTGCTPSRPTYIFVSIVEPVLRIQQDTACQVQPHFQTHRLTPPLEKHSKTLPDRWIRSVLFWDITQRWVVVLYQRFGTTCRVHRRGSTEPVIMGPIGCPETSVQNYHSTLCNIPEERRSHLNRGGSMVHLNGRGMRWCNCLRHSATS
jgi:hypothetical protein